MKWDQLETQVMLAHALWSSEARTLSPSKFRELFDKAYENANDLETLWQLGGAINDYLRRFPGVLPVPPELPWRLLGSDDQESRVIGLKLLIRCDVPADRTIDEIIKAIERNDDYESHGGFYELGNLLERCRDNGKTIPASSAERLRQVLQRSLIDGDDNSRQRAEYLLYLLETTGSVESGVWNREDRPNAGGPSSTAPQS